ncbi:MAG: S8 family serine peptidase, partial [Oscillospiraceae bacterium]|nr:S8 family serine peptidase [Oscillospiraceae bacterium]
SADNTLTVRTKTLVVGDKNIRFSGMIDTDMSPLFLDECFEQNETGEYEYVFCGGGGELDYMGIDAAGKIAVVNRGNHFNEILSSARAAGALGVLIINNTAESIEPLMKEGDFEEYAPVGMVSQEDGKLLLEAEKKVIRFRNDAESFASFEKPTDVSSYSSWGVQNSLVLRPDIMGIGGSVESAAYEGKASLMSGTSMSSPYVAGCVAVFNQYLEAQGCKLTSSERMKYIRNLLMTSAVPYQKDDMYVTPRRQGAGLISLDNALSDTVLLTGKEGETKINLFDQLGDTFTFEVTLTNIGKEDVTFENAKLCLTTDALQSDENMNIDIIEGQQKLTADAVLDGVKTVKAGETRTEKITVKLDAKQTAALKEKFIAGFFVEGYLLLGGAKNCCDISIPMLGFYGDWTAVSIFTGENSLMYGIGGATLSAGASLFRISEICNEIKARLTPEQLAEYEAALAPSSDLTDLLAPTQNPISLLMEYATEEEMAALTPEDQTIFLSPNMDGIADMFGVQAGVQRNAMISGACVMDGSGKVLIEGSQSQPCGKAAGGILLPSAADLRTLEDGEYYGGMLGYIDYGDAAEHPQFTESSLVIDKTAPEMTGTIREENGKKILTLKVSDKYLDGIVLLGVSEKPDDAHAM